MALPPVPEEDLTHILERTRELWEEARGARFFITGGTGFFGMWLLESFVFVNERLNLQASATVLTRDAKSFAKKAPHLAGRSDLRFLEGDVRSFPFPGEEFEFLIHAAAGVSARLDENGPGELLESITGGMKHVLNFAARAKVKKLLFTSSGAVYGAQPPEMERVSEDYPGAPDPLKPDSAYGEGKRIAELMGAIHARRHPECEVKIARCFAFVGPHLPLDSGYAIGNFLRDALRGATIRVKGDGTPRRSYLYAADLAIWLWTILFRGTSGRAYNVGSPSCLSIGETAFLVREALGGGVDVEIQTPPDDSRAPSRYVPSTERARSELSLEPLVSLRDAILKTARWCRNTELY